MTMEFNKLNRRVCPWRHGIECYNGSISVNNITLTQRRRSVMLNVLESCRLVQGRGETWLFRSRAANDEFDGSARYSTLEMAASTIWVAPREISLAPYFYGASFCIFWGMRLWYTDCFTWKGRVKRLWRELTILTPVHRRCQNRCWRKRKGNF